MIAAVGHNIVRSVWVGTIAICVILLAGTPLISAYFPDYVAGYLIQVPATIVFVWYFRHFRILRIYQNWRERAFLILSFTIPLANTFILKALRKAAFGEHIMFEIFRPTILLLLVIAMFSASKKGRTSLPITLRLSFFASIAGWLLASFFSHYPILALGHGFFEVAAPWIALLTLLRIAPDREFLLHAAVLFLIGFSLVAVAQAVVILAGLSGGIALGLPVAATEFLDAKMDLPLMVEAGGNAYGNTDNFASLWCLVVVLVSGLAYASRRWRWIAWTGFAVVVYAGLLVYPRSALGAVVLGLLGLWLYRWRVWRSASLGILISLALIGAIYVNPAIVDYYVTGAELFIAILVPSSGSSEGDGFLRSWALKHREIEYAGGEFGVDRAAAWSKGIEIAKNNWITGIGFGAYSIVEPRFTAPHSLVLERIDDGGILSLFSILLMAGYCFWQSLVLLVRKPTDIAGAAAIIAVSVFFVKAFVFGATFSIMGLIPWGFAVQLCLAIFLTGTGDVNLIGAHLGDGSKKLPATKPT